MEFGQKSKGKVRFLLIVLTRVIFLEELQELLHVVVTVLVIKI